MGNDFSLIVCLLPPQFSKNRMSNVRDHGDASTRLNSTLTLFSIDVVSNDLTHCFRREVDFLRFRWVTFEMGGCTAKQATRAVSPVRITPGTYDLLPVDRGKNLESYCLFWLDSTARSPELIEASDELRAIINYVKIFESIKECQDEVRRTTDGKIFLITSMRQGLSLLTTVHDHPQLDSVYMYDSGNTKDRQENQYSKVIFDRFLLSPVNSSLCFC